MKKRHLFVLGLAALMGVPEVAVADDKPPAAGRKAEDKPGKQHKPGMPGHDGMPGMPGHDGMPGHPGMRDGAAAPGVHAEERDGGAPGQRGYKNALRALYQDLKDGKLKKDELKAKLAQLQDTRGERRKEHREELGKRWGTTLAQAPAREELKTHARRMAFLNRALVLAQEDTKPDKDKTLERISQLIDKENARHDRAMTRLQSQPAGATTAAAPTPVPSTANIASGGSQ
ncbi:MAG TPA: collagen-like protein [Polyangiaceae bacterium]|nr:collagen-like protein [Polyangiaceae bacterium]